MRILLAECDESSRKLATMILKRLDYDVDFVTNGKEVLKALSRRSYDMILMDIRMPEMDGFQVTQLIRGQYPCNMQPKIIAITAYLLPNCRERCLEAGMDDFMAKPVRIEDLASLLSKHTSRQEQ